MKAVQRYAIIFATLFLATTSQARLPDNSWFVGTSFYGFELNGSGTMSTFDDPETEFDVRRVYSYGMVDGNVLTSETSLGLGWDDTQLPGFELQLGFRHNWRFTTRLDMFWALTKRADKYGAPTEGQLSLVKQSTTFKQSHVRVMLDWTPFEPLPLVFLTGGIEYTEFSARLEFHFDRYVNDEPQERQYSVYEDSGSTFGVVLGAGLIIPSKSSTGQSYLAFTYSYAPYTKDWFAWDSDINFGGAGLELGYRWFLGGDE